MAADTKMSNLISSTFPSTYTQTEAAPYLRLSPLPLTRKTLKGSIIP